MFDYHPDAIPAPYNHSNIQSDEVIYYAEGKFMSRKSIDRCDITLHPFGLPHGPQPGATEASIGAKRTEELAVMVDTFYPLQLTAEALEMEKTGYQDTWLEGDGEASFFTAGWIPTPLINGKQPRGHPRRRPQPHFVGNRSTQAHS